MIKHHHLPKCRPFRLFIILLSPRMNWNDSENKKFKMQLNALRFDLICFDRMMILIFSNGNSNDDINWISIWNKMKIRQNWTKNSVPTHIGMPWHSEEFSAGSSMLIKLNIHSIIIFVTSIVVRTQTTSYACEESKIWKGHLNWHQTPNCNKQQSHWSWIMNHTIITATALALALAPSNSQHKRKNKTLKCSFD